MLKGKATVRRNHRCCVRHNHNPQIPLTLLCVAVLSRSLCRRDARPGLGATAPDLRGWNDMHNTRHHRRTRRVMLYPAKYPALSRLPFDSDIPLDYSCHCLRRHICAEHSFYWLSFSLFCFWFLICPLLQVAFLARFFTLPRNRSQTPL